MSESILPLRLRDILHVARRRGASDIHLMPGVAAAIRSDGVLQQLDGAALEPSETAALARMLLGERLAQALPERRDVTSTWVDDTARAARVHAFYARDGVCLALRLLRDRVPELQTLGLPGAVNGFVGLERGLVIFAGPTGSGKSTSLAALVEEINRSRACRIVTVEDPVEYRYTSALAMITQREVGADVASFDAAVHGALRADPDVLLIGEMRDPATMRAALVAAETGHLVLTTLHTGTAAQTVDRIVDAFEGSEQSYVRAQLAQALTAVVCQRLVARAERQGRRAVAEVLIVNDAVRTIIREGRTHQLRNAMVTARHEGMQTLEQHASELVAGREIDSEVAAAL